MGDVLGEFVVAGAEADVNAGAADNQGEFLDSIPLETDGAAHWLDAIQS